MAAPRRRRGELDGGAQLNFLHELAESEHTCPHHGVELERIGEVVSEQLDIVPAKVRVLRHIRGKYRCPSCEGHLRTAALRARLDGPELAPLREVMFRWVQHLAKRRNRPDLGMEDMAEIDRMHESGETEAYFAARLRAWQDEDRAEGRAQGIEQGLERGLAAERALLCRQAGRKFSADTAERLAGLLATVDDTDRPAQVGEWIIDCETGERLIARFGNGAG